MPIELICLDADDTLWHNMRYFEAAESALAAMLEPFTSVAAVRRGQHEHHRNRPACSEREPIVLEMHTLTIYLLAAAAACIAGGTVALAGGGLVWTLSSIAIAGAVALPLAHWTRGRLKNRASGAQSQRNRV